MDEVRVGVLGGARTSAAVDAYLATCIGARRSARPPWDAVVALGAGVTGLPALEELAEAGVPLLVSPHAVGGLPSAARALVLRPPAFFPGIAALRREVASQAGTRSVWQRMEIGGGLPRHEAGLGVPLEAALALVLAVNGPEIRAARARRIQVSETRETIRIGVAGEPGRYAEIELAGRTRGGRGGALRLLVDTPRGTYAWHRYADVERLRFQRREPDPDSGHNVARAQYAADPLPPALRALLALARSGGRPVWGVYEEGRLRHLVSRCLELLRHPASWPASGGAFLLVQLPRRRPYGDTLRLMNLGIARLAGALREDGVPVRVADLDAAAWQAGLDVDALGEPELVARAVAGDCPPALDRLLDELERRLPLASAAVVGFSVVDREGAAHLAVARLLARRVRRRRPDALIVLGGVTDELHAEEVLAEEPAIDLVVEGDGEVAARRLIEAHVLGLGAPGNAPNVCLRAEKEGGSGARQRSVFRTAARTVRLVDRPRPDFDGFSLDAYRRGISEGLRRALSEGGLLDSDDVGAPRLYLPFSFVLGCLGRCTFCGFGDRVDLLPGAQAASQLARLAARYDCRDFVFLDTTVNLSPRRLERLCDAIIAAGLDLRWTDSARPDGFGPRLARKMREAGCVMLSFGVESGSDRVLARMRKGFVRAQVEDTLAAVHEAGILTRVNLIAGYLHEQDEDIDATVSFVEEQHRNIDLIGCFNGFQLSPSAGYSPREHGIRLLPFTDVVDPDQLSLAYDEVGGLAWSEKKEQIRRSRRAVLRAIEGKGIYYGAVVDEYDLFWLSRRFSRAAEVRRWLLRQEAADATLAERPPAGPSPAGPSCSPRAARARPEPGPRSP